MFFTNGVLFSALLPRYPELKDAFGLSNTSFGLAVVSFPAGAICAAGAGAPIIRRFGAARVTLVGTVLLAVAMAGAGLSANVGLFAGALAIAGLTDAVVDAAQNVEGVAVERSMRRSILNSLHAVWSLGAATGGLIGAAAAVWHVPIGAQMVTNGAVWCCVAFAANRLATARTPNEAIVADTKSAPVGATSMHAWRLLLPFILLAMCGTLIEDVANNWAVLFFRQETSAPASVAGLALTAVLVFQFLGRLAGDPMTDRWGREQVARFGGILITIGMVIAAFAPGYVLAFAGFGMAGLGCATLVPAAFAAADRVPGLPAGTGIAILGWLMRLGFLITSPSMGALSDATNLRTALVIPATAGVVAATMAHIALRQARIASRANLR